MKLKNVSIQLTSSVVVGIFLMIGSTGCETVSLRELPQHCIHKGEWPGYDKVVAQKWDVFDVSLDDKATANLELADRVDYLETYCWSINAFRDEHMESP